MVLVFNAKRRLSIAAAAAGVAAFLGACSSTPTAPAQGTAAGAGAGSVPGTGAGAGPGQAGAGQSAPAPSQNLLGEMPPAAPREFRAAWVSTVANIDWPSKSSLPPSRQQAEVIAILDRAKALHLNAIVLQVRPSADAIYPSKLEPWSEFLTGQQGKAPEPAWDPLAFWINQAHARGMELHAWFNPYRARHSAARTPNAPGHVANAKPQVVRQYGKMQWMDPGEEAAAQHTLDVILDVVRRYDIDGVHIDDYFYPYPIEAPGANGGEAALDAPSNGNKPELEFPDHAAWQRYQQGGGTLDRASWRRQNVNQLIEAIYGGIRKEKSWVRFGISPFGIGRPDRRPPGIQGFSQYDKLYADAELWLQNGWLDYLAPQLYWPIAQQPQAFPVLLDYWLGQNKRGRHIWPGLYTSRIDDSVKSFTAEEIVQQVGVTRSRPNVNGHIHFSMAALMQNRKGVSDQLKAASYQGPALVPASPWLGSEAPPAPTVSVKRHASGLAVALGNAQRATHVAIWARYGEEWRFNVVPSHRGEVVLTDDNGVPARGVVVSAVDRLGNESPRVAAAL
ncbi:family 10 glycosylhydrolase [Pseudoduganella sp. DS3]|uniref:Family 10 glycosylhydrolase n=1 Tax=Pseudoduganella guangdongensis TaxID=2692179 RepID=A0A6N9HBY4_9BURK|nr:family 10 glycosylhydrolase [Pseudoduganella guangdongensis]MYN01071.1 family 10 glycosylhydrolase [Pseudoduganella guangdongensis]